MSVTNGGCPREPHPITGLRSSLTWRHIRLLVRQTDTHVVGVRVLTYAIGC